MEDFRDAIKEAGQAQELLGVAVFPSGPQKQRRSRYDRAAEISEKITDSAEIAGAVALNTSKWRRAGWARPARPSREGGEGGVAAWRNHTVAEEGAEEVVDDEVVVDDEDAEEVEEAAGRGGGGGGRTICAARPEVAPRPPASSLAAAAAAGGRRRRGRAEPEPGPM